MKSLLSFDPLNEKTASDVTVSGAKVTIPAGKYRDDVNKFVNIVDQSDIDMNYNNDGLVGAYTNQSVGYVENGGHKRQYLQLPVQAAQTIIPGAYNQIIESGKFITGAQTILGDANLIPANIVAGKSIFGVNGSFSLSNMQLVVICYGINTITATNGSVTKTAIGTQDTFGFIDLTTGTWTVTATNGNLWCSKNIYINETSTQVIYMQYESIPVFTYTGVYQIVDDNDNIITHSDNNWKIRFLTSGTLTFSNLNGARGGIDCFLVGGGGGSGGISSWNCGGGGGGGYAGTVRGASLYENTPYNIVIGAGGAGASSSSGTGSAGGNTGFAYVGEVAGGGGGGPINGGNGGSGGGSGGSQSNHGHGGSDGANGGGGNGGTGQGYTTREFNEAGRKLYAGGGSPGYGNNQGSNPYGDNNTGCGMSSPAGGESSAHGLPGYSGIVVIRNRR